MTLSPKRFAWHDRDTAARDLLQLAYHAPGGMSRTALELIWIIGSSSSIVWQLEDLVLDPNRALEERRYALWSMAAASGDFYFPRLSRLATYKVDDSGLSLRFSDVARLAKNHPSNLKWLLSNFETRSPSIYLQALKTVTYCEDREILDPVLVGHLIAFLNHHPSLLDVELFKRLVCHAGPFGQWWLSDHIDQVIELYDKGEQLDTFLHVLQQRHELAGPIMRKQPRFSQILSHYGEEQRERAHLENLRAAKAHYRESATWKKLYDLYRRAQDDSLAAANSLRDIAMNRTCPRPIRVVATFFLGYLQHQHPHLILFLCSLVKRNDGQDSDWGYAAPIRQEALLALRYSPTPMVWEALIEGYFYNQTNFLDWLYPSTIRYITDSLTRDYSPLERPREPFPSHRLNSEIFHALADIEIDFSHSCS